jgi:hypothetical protein
MPWLITLMLLACAPLLVGYLAWRYHCCRGVSTHDRHHLTTRQGELTLPSMIAGPERERVIRWMEASPTVFENVGRVLREYDQCKTALEAAQTDRARFQQQCEALREEARQLHAELGRLQKERADAAHWVTTMLQEAAARFPLTPPPA